MPEIIINDSDCPRDSVTVPPGKNTSMNTQTFDPSRDTNPEFNKRRLSTREFTRPDIELSLEQVLEADSKLAVAMFDTRLRITKAKALGLPEDAPWHVIHKCEDAKNDPNITIN